MAKYLNVITGNFEGTVGSVVGARWKGIYYMRSKAKPGTYTPTIAQLAHRSRFSLVSKFVHSIGKLLMHCYPQTSTLTGINHAFADVYAKAVRGSYPSFALDYSQVLISKGELHNATNPAAIRLTGNVIEFKWVDNSDNSMANADDKAVMLLYCPALQKSIYTLSGPTRATEKSSLDAGCFSGYPIESWLTFMSVDGEAVATSMYCGKLVRM